MLSEAKFYGESYTIPNGSPLLRLGALRVVDISNVENGTNAASVTLPARFRGKVPIPTGGPYFEFVNRGPRTIGLKDAETGNTFWNVHPNEVATVCLSTSKWVAFTDALGTAKPLATRNLRTQPIGFVPDVTPFTAPTDYDPITCDGGFRRARFCGNGGHADIWMATDEVDPHFVAGVAAFSFNEGCYYFKASDPTTLGHGFTLTATQVSWSATCGDCTDPPGPPPPTPVPCILPDGLPTAFTLSWHNKVRLDPGPAGYGYACVPTCEADPSAVITQSAPGHWRKMTPTTVCSGAEMASVEVYHQTLGDGTCCWEAYFNEGVGYCRTVFRKFTGNSPAGGGWVQVDPASAWTCGSDGDTHNVCSLTQLDAVTNVNVA